MPTNKENIDRAENPEDTIAATRNITAALSPQELATNAQRLPPQISGLAESIAFFQGTDELNNFARLEIEGINIVNPVKIIKGPGYDIERIPNFLQDGRHNDVPGFATPHPFIFEAAGDDAVSIKAYFDQYLLNPMDYAGRSMSIIIQNLDQSEACRWNFLDLVPDSCNPSINDFTRFRWTKRYLPHEDRRFTGLVIYPDPGDPNGEEPSNNLQTDKRIEIPGVTTAVFYPQVDVNEANRTVTCVFRSNEGKGIFPWVKNFVQGISDKRSMSIIEEENGTEVSRRNYFECFPVKYEQFSGFSLYAKLMTRVVIAFSFSEDA